MNIWNKVMLILIALLGILAIFLSAMSLKINSKQGINEVKQKEAIATERKNFEKQMEPDTGLPFWESRHHQLLSDRGECWKNCKPGAFSAEEDGRAKIGFYLAEGSTGNMKQKDLVYVFDQGVGVSENAEGEAPVEPQEEKKPWKYLGRFSVSSIERGNEVYAESLDVLNEEELQRIQMSLQSGAAWIVYGSLPVDRADFYANMDDAEKEKYLPPNVLQEYSQAGIEDRPTNYGVLFSGFYAERIRTREAINDARSIKDSYDASVKEADQQRHFLQTEQDRYKKEIALMEEQAQEMEQLCDSLKRTNQKMEQDIRNLQSENEKMVEQIKKLQQEALRKSSSASTVQDSDILVRN